MRQGPPGGIVHNVPLLEVDLEMLESNAGESKRRGKLIAVKLRLLVCKCKASNHDSIHVIGTRVLANGRLKVSRT